VAFSSGPLPGIFRATMTTLVKHRLSSITLALGLVCSAAACDSGETDKKDAKSDDKSDEKGDDKADDKKAGDTDEKAGDTDEKKAGDTDEKTGETDTKPAPGGTVLAPGEAGPAYFAINMKGIAKLDESGWSMIQADENKLISDMFIGPDGAVYVLDYQGLHKINGDKLEKVLEFGYKDIGSVSNLGMVKGGDLWATNYKGVGHYTGGKWTLTEKDKIGDDGIDMLTGVAVGSDGVPLISGSKVILKLDGDKWNKVDLSALGENPYIFRLAASTTGEVFGQTSRELVKLSGEKAELIEINSKNFMGYGAAMEFGPTGEVAVSSSLCDLARLDPAKPDDVWLLSKDDLDCLSFQALSIDGQSRVWISSREGLSIVGPDKNPTEYPTGTVMELVGNVSKMVVVGKGPNLPAVPAAHTGGVTGKVLQDGSAIAGAKIEMCTSPQIFGSGSPCSSAKTKFSGTTTDKGEFTFEKVPLGDYNVAVEIDGKWRSNYIPSFATKMKEGATYDVGAVTYSKM